MPKLLLKCAVLVVPLIMPFAAVTAQVATKAEKGSAPSRGSWQAAANPSSRPIEADGSVNVPSFRLPPSEYMSAEAKAALPRVPSDMFEVLRQSPKDVTALRTNLPRLVAGRVAQLKRMYKVETEERAIAGVPAVWTRPMAGITPAKSGKILLNLPGGGFMIANAGANGMFETIPLSGLMGVEGVSITYRQGPEAHYPDATEDVVKVYRELLKTHKSQDVVIYGCSAGGQLTAQTTAALIRDKLPLPAAIGLLCASADMRLLGDSAAFTSPFQAIPNKEIRLSYFEGIKLDDPAVSPLRSPDVLRHFPPTLIVTGSRALEMSSAVATNNALQKCGAVSQLNIWDGMGHAFFYDIALPESREAFDTMARFFTKYLHLKP